MIKESICIWGLERRWNDIKLRVKSGESINRIVEEEVHLRYPENSRQMHFFRKDLKRNLRKRIKLFLLNKIMIRIRGEK